MKSGTDTNCTVSKYLRNCCNKAHFSLTDFHIEEPAIFLFFGTSFSPGGTDKNGHHSGARNLRNMATSQDTECPAWLYSFLSLFRRNIRTARCVTTRERRLLTLKAIRIWNSFVKLPFFPGLRAGSQFRSSSCSFYTWACEPLARVPKMARGIYCCPSFCSFCPTSLSTRILCILCVCVCVHSHIWHRTDCTWITVVTKQHCSKTLLHQCEQCEVLTGYLSLWCRSVW
jgi:hypothetical protein